MRSRLIVICGLPGSGKTTLATRLEQSTGAVRLCPDEWMAALAIPPGDGAARGRVESLQWALARRLLALGQTAIIEWGTWGRDERDVLRTAARALGAGVELHYLTAPVQTLFDRVCRRGMEDPPLTLDDLHRSAAKFQEPTGDELALYDVATRTEP